MTTGSKDLIRLVDEHRVAEVQNKGRLRDFLNHEPPQAWVKKHPMHSDVNHLPIDKVESLLDSIFQEWRVEVLSVQQLAQSICVTVRLHYLHPINNEWTYHDGVGAVPLNTDKGFSAADLSHIKSDAVATGAPAAKSFAIKNAASHIGKIFGRDLNRKETVTLRDFYEEKSTANAFEEEIKLLEEAKTMPELLDVWKKLRVDAKKNKAVVEAKDKMKEKLSASS